LTPTLERLRAQFGTSIDPKQVKQLGILDTLLGQLIERSYSTRRHSASASKSPTRRVRARSYNNPAFRGPDGKFDRQLFAQALMQNRISEDQLGRPGCGTTSRAATWCRRSYGDRRAAPVVDALHRYRNEKRLADIVAFPVAAVGNYRPAERG